MSLSPGARLQLRMSGDDGSVKVADWRIGRRAVKFGVRCARPGEALRSC